MANLLLEQVQATTRHRLVLAGTQVLLSDGQALQLPYQIADHVYFIERGFASVQGFGTESHRISLGIIGRDGLSALPFLQGVEASPYGIRTAIAGSALQIPIAAFSSVLDDDPDFKSLLLRYAYSLNVQIAETACAVPFILIRRLARMLLLIAERSISRTLAITHEDLAVMLGVRRPAMTLAVQLLEGERYVGAHRKRIEILDFGGLRDFAGCCYGTASQEYERCVGPFSPLDSAAIRTPPSP